MKTQIEKTKEEKLLKLVEKITEKGNRYRARQLVRILEEAEKKNGGIIEYLRESKNEIVRGIASTLEYLLTDEDNKDLYCFKEKYGGWGLYKPLKTGEHTGGNSLWFARIGGNAKINGKYAGKKAELYDNSQASGEYAGLEARFYNNSKASGKYAGKKAKFYDNSQASGKEAGRKADFYNNSQASGEYAGLDAIFFDWSQASGEKAGSWAMFFDWSQARGKYAGKKAEFYDNSKASGSYAGKKAKFYDNSKANNHTNLIYRILTRTISLIN